MDSSIIYHGRWCQHQCSKPSPLGGSSRTIAGTKPTGAKGCCNRAQSRQPGRGAVASMQGASAPGGGLLQVCAHFRPGRLAPFRFNRCLMPGGHIRFD